MDTEIKNLADRVLGYLASKRIVSRDARAWMEHDQVCFLDTLSKEEKKLFDDAIQCLIDMGFFELNERNSKVLMLTSKGADILETAK